MKNNEISSANDISLRIIFTIWTLEWKIITLAVQSDQWERYRDAWTGRVIKLRINPRWFISTGINIRFPLGTFSHLHALCRADNEIRHFNETMRQEWPIKPSWIIPFFRPMACEPSMAWSPCCPMVNLERFLSRWINRWIGEFYFQRNPGKKILLNIPTRYIHSPFHSPCYLLFGIDYCSILKAFGYYLYSFPCRR